MCTHWVLRYLPSLTTAQSAFTPGLRFFGSLPDSGSTGPCSGPSTLINVVGKRNNLKFQRLLAMTI